MRVSQTILAILSLASLLLSCTRDKEEGAATLRFDLAQVAKSTKMKSSSSSKISSNKLELLNSETPNWNTSLNPTSSDQINCYAVFVGGPEASMSINSCSDSTGVEKFRFGSSLLLVPPTAGTVSLEVPSGSGRTISLVGFRTNAGACVTTTPNGAEPDFANISEPYILSEQTLNLAPGDQNINMIAIVDESKKIADCDFFEDGDENTESGPQWLQASAIQTVDSTSNVNTSIAKNLEWSSVASASGQTSLIQNLANPDQLIVSSAGDYFLSVSLPLLSAGGTARQMVVMEALKNGAVIPGMTSMTYIRNSSGHNSSSLQMSGLITGLSAGDTITVRTKGILDLGNDVDIDGSANVFIEQVGEDRVVFSGTATTVTAGANINSASPDSLEWTSDRKDSGYVHDNASSPENITVNSAGNYFVNINIPYIDLAPATLRIALTAKVLRNGSVIAGGIMDQGYLRGSTGNDRASLHWSGVVKTLSPSDVISVSIENPATGTNAINVLTGHKATISIEQLPSTDSLISLRSNSLTSGTNWNPASSVDLLWTAQQSISSGTFSHSTSTNSESITILESGNYLLSFSDSLTSGIARANTSVQISLNGSPISGAKVSSHHIRSTGGHTSSSGTISLLLPNVNSGDVLSVGTVQAAAAGTVDDLNDAKIFLIKK